MTMTEKLAAFAAATNNELFDAEWQGGEWMVNAVQTAETLAEWEESSRNWNERTAMKSGEVAGFPFRAWSRAQPLKGMPRESISVIDFGDYRFVIHGSDLTAF